MRVGSAGDDVLERWAGEGGEVRVVGLIGAEAARGIDAEGEGDDAGPDDCCGEGQ